MGKLSTVITLRDTMTLNYSTAFSFYKIVVHTDLPINFDQITKVWWRWYSDIYGFFYNRVKCSYSVWLTTFLKKNVGVYMSFFFKVPGKRSKILSNWRRRAFLYQTTMIKKIPNIFFSNHQKLNFWLIHYNILSEAAKETLLTGNRGHKPIGSYGMFGLETSMFISSYNGKWNNLYKPESLFYNCGRMPRDFMVIVNSFFISPGFFINSYDSLLTLYPQYFLEYHNKIFDKDFVSLISFFELKNNKMFYKNILLLIKCFYIDSVFFKLFKFIDLNLLKNLSFSIYKINLYLFFIRYLVKFYKKTIIINYFFIFLIFLNKYNFSNILMFKNTYMNITNSFDFVYYVYFSNYINFSKNWLSEKYLVNKQNYKYDFIFKYLNKFSLFNLNIKNLENFLYFKKLYVVELIYLWGILNDSPINLDKISNKNQSKFFIDKFNEMFRTKYEKFKNTLSILDYFSNIKTKYLKTGEFKPLIFSIKPSLKTFKLTLMTKLLWVTHFGKHFVTVPYEYESLKDTAFFFTNSLNKFRIISYIKYLNTFLEKVKEFLVDFFSFLTSHLKINFGLSYSLLLNTDEFNPTVMDSYYFYNIQHYLYTYFSFIKQYFNKPESFNLKPFNVFDKNFFFILYTFCIKNNNIKKMNTKKFFLSNYRGINLNAFGYLKILSNF